MYKAIDNFSCYLYTKTTSAKTGGVQKLDKNTSQKIACISRYLDVFSVDCWPFSWTMFVGEN
jgi:hypothetical protein